jgi:NitT/TauT family transport system substrate-binding protein
MLANRRLTAIGVLLTLVLLIATCGPLPEKAPESTSLRVMLQPYMGSTTMAIAQEEGYFAEEGLEVEFVQLDSSAEAVLPLLQRELDVVPGAVASGILNAIAREGSLKFVLSYVYFDPEGCTFFGIVAPNELLESGALEDPAQLRGKRVAVRPGLIDDFILETALAKYGVTGEEVEKVSIPPPNQPDALASGAVDLVVAAEPALSRILGSGDAGLWIEAQEVLPNMTFAAIIFGPSLLEDNPEVGERFMRAYLKALEQYREGKTDRNLEIASNLTGLPIELLEQACWLQVPEGGRINPQSILDYQAWALEKGYLDSLVPEEDFWDPSFLEAAQD